VNIHLQVIKVDGKEFALNNIGCSVPCKSVLGSVPFISYSEDVATLSSMHITSSTISSPMVSCQNQLQSLKMVSKVTYDNTFDKFVLV